MNIKTLNWKETSGEQVAETPFGDYRFFQRFSVVANEVGPVLAFACCEESVWDLNNDAGLTFDLAQQLAQADFNAKVQACLMGN